ncbi:MAG: glycoside hydrolase family 92 protein, partial [Muribaculaceae bacterium]|nr:glycoside hydrolase family 92 protein [Muribaculaceae bacterium]
MRSLICTILLFAASNVYAEELWRYVDPKIGSEGLGRVFIGPSSPFGMVKPSPDCTVSPNSGWLPMPTQVNGFAQVHVSGTGGGPKYGNILLMPFTGGLTSLDHIAHRKFEEISLGYYATEFEENGIKTEITTAPKASFYRCLLYTSDA